MTNSLMKIHWYLPQNSVVISEIITPRFREGLAQLFTILAGRRRKKNKMENQPNAIFEVLPAEWQSPTQSLAMRAAQWETGDRARMPASEAEGCCYSSNLI